MALKLRLQRYGNKNRPFYHMVVTDSRNARNGKFIEKLGTYNPIQGPGPALIEMNVERAAHWYRIGARPTDAVASLLRAKNVNLAHLPGES